MDIQDDALSSFRGLAFESDAFGAWYGGRLQVSNRDGATGLRQIEGKEQTSEKLTIPELGEVEAIRSVSVADGQKSSEMKTRSIVRIRFAELRSLTEVIEIAAGLGRELINGIPKAV
ncbi:MAG: hypothetical protein ABL928_07630 [Sphingorhabdus sp.]